jgi:hypothetical protein
MKKKVFILIVVVILFNSCGFNCDNYLNTQIKPLLINGVVISKSGDKCFGEIVIRQENKLDTLKNICYCTPDNEGVWHYVVPNDSIYKGRGSLIITVIRQDKRQQFKYPCCNE